jgi:hypothetical protein
MDVPNRSQGRFVSGRSWTSLRRSLALLAWILAWTLVFSTTDFYTICLFHIDRYSWFQDYRNIMGLTASWISPPSFALAENVYFVWLNLFDPNRTMREWAWYVGNPANPDGQWNFVWGAPHGWSKYPVLKWYGLWAIPSLLWFVAIDRLILSRAQTAALQPLRANRFNRFTSMLLDNVGLGPRAAASMSKAVLRMLRQVSPGSRDPHR